MALKAVTFDFIETLLDGHSRDDLFFAMGEIAKEDKTLRPVLLKAAQEYGPKRRQDIKDLKQSSLSDLIGETAKEMGQEMTPEDLLKFNDKLFSLATAEAKLFDDVEETLTALKERKLALGILSNVSFPGSFYDRLLETMGIAHFFDAKVWSSDIGTRKPSPQIFSYALGEMRITPAEGIHVGDVPNRDVRGAHEAGMRAVWINRKGALRQPDEEEADWEVKTLSEFVLIADKEMS